MNSYLLLDSWVLSEYSKREKREELVTFIRERGYTGVINALSLVEVYNPGWIGAGLAERGASVARLLASVPFVIADPTNVIRTEFERFPAAVENLPVELSSEDLGSQSEEALLCFLRGDPLFRLQEKNVADWAQAYGVLKAAWPDSVVEILEHGVVGGLLRRVGHRYEVVSMDRREEFLCSLDLRMLALFSAEERRALGTKIVELALGGTKRLPAVRLSSLLFLNAHIERDPANRPKTAASDTGDYWHMILSPYCGAVTVDRAMGRLLERTRAEAGLACLAWDAPALRELLSHP